MNDRRLIFLMLTKIETTRRLSIAFGSSTGTMEDAPRIALRMQVHARLVVATTGIRIHIGEKAKLTIVTGTQT